MLRRCDANRIARPQRCASIDAPRGVVSADFQWVREASRGEGQYMEKPSPPSPQSGLGYGGPAPLSMGRTTALRSGGRLKDSVRNSAGKSGSYEWLKPVNAFGALAAEHHATASSQLLVLHSR